MWDTVDAQPNPLSHEMPCHADTPATRTCRAQTTATAYRAGSHTKGRLAQHENEVRKGWLEAARLALGTCWTCRHRQPDKAQQTAVTTSNQTPAPCRSVWGSEMLDP